jgi:hypothetical protein
MDSDVHPKADATARPTSQPENNGQPNDAERHAEPTVDTDTDTVDHARDAKVTRLVHIALGLLVAAVAGWLLYRSHTELAFRGSNGEPGPGYLPVLLTLCLVGLGLLLAGVWAFGKKAREGDAPTLSLHPAQMGRALLVWGALVVCGFLIEPLGFLIAGEVFVLIIMAIERIRSVVLIITLLLIPPAMYLLFDTLLEVQLPGGTLWY